jgi:hypothetical protein
MLKLIKTGKLTFAGIVLLSLIGQSLNAQQDQQKYRLENSAIRSVITEEGLVSAVDPADPLGADVVGRPWGIRKLAYRTEQAGEWINFFDDSVATVSGGDNRVQIVAGENTPVTLTQLYTLAPDGLDLDITLRSSSERPVTVGDLALALPWRRPSGEKPEYIFEQCFTKHHYISGNGSFIFFTKPSGEPPFMVVVPKEGTSLEYFDNSNRAYNAFIHSELSGNSVESGTWRQEHTGLTLDPASPQGASASYGFRFRWADSWDDLRKILYDEGLFDVRVVPGMTVPTDLSARFSLHTKNRIDSITAEFPAYTDLKFTGENLSDHYLYEVSFRKLGENMLTVHYENGKKTYLEFFSTEPVETLIKKRASFLVESQQHRNPELWYDGLYSVYDMKNGVLRGPDNTDGFDGWWGYVLACDDPGLSKAPFLASKNVYFPDDKEIWSLEYYLEKFVWNGLQRTDTDDPYPYGIYGVPNWKEAREWKPREPDTTGKEILHVWRSYDYPHIAMLYYHMYQIAKMYPDKVTYLDADGYLERAYQTAKAYFLYPYDILPYYDTYKWGCYNELVFENIMADLEEEGRHDEAAWLRNEYEKKVKYAVYDDKYPFRSEYALDRTAFESSYAFAKYGTLNDIEPDENSWYDRNVGVWRSHPVVRKSDARDFMDRQHMAGLAVRGWLETKYFLLGGDFTSSSDNHCLSYMAIMGGRSILDYGVNFAGEPSDWLQLGYASYLSSWSLMNTGTEESDYGFWAPGKENDGAVGWAFMESKHGRAWIRKDVDRGAWFYDGEIDLGLGAATRTAMSVLTNDPLFGWVAYGAVLNEDKKGFTVIPKDGIRNRFALVTDETRLMFDLDRDGIDAESGVRIDKNGGRITFTIDNRYNQPHITRIRLENHTGDNFVVKLDGKKLTTRNVAGGTWIADMKVTGANHKVTIEESK